jgi:hypothetical protein
MARLGAFSPILEPRAWFHPRALAEGWFADELLTGPAVSSDVTITVSPVVGLPAFPATRIGFESDWFLAGGAWNAGGIWYDAAPWSDVITVVPVVGLPAFPATTIALGAVTLSVSPVVGLPAFPAVTIIPGSVTITVAPMVGLPAFPPTSISSLFELAAQRTSLQLDSAAALTLSIDAALGLGLRLDSAAALTIEPIQNALA